MQNLNYNNVRLRDINTTSPIVSPVVLTMPDRRKQAEREEAIKWFFAEIEKADKSVEEFGWVDQEDIEREFGLR